ncbi:MAG: methyltransferase [Cyclobacteriaceae bacterium]|jgi:protein-S-isoprenylcysteine O-methyltransferase Ste14
MIHLRIFLPIFFLLYFLLTFLMYAPKRKDKPPKLKTVTLLNNLIWLLVIALTTVFSLFPKVYHQYVVPFETLKTHTLSWVAIGIMSVAFMVVFSAKNQQRLNRGSEQKGWLLLTKGIYSKTRNPLHLGQLITLIGFFLCIPSIYSGIILLLGAFIVFVRVGLEEKVLENVFEEDYLAYERKVDRWG